MTRQCEHVGLQYESIRLGMICHTLHYTVIQREADHSCHCLFVCFFCSFCVCLKFILVSCLLFRGEGSDRKWVGGDKAWDQRRERRAASPRTRFPWALQVISDVLEMLSLCQCLHLPPVPCFQLGPRSCKHSWLVCCLSRLMFVKIVIHPGHVIQTWVHLWFILHLV